MTSQVEAEVLPQQGFVEIAGSTTGRERFRPVEDLGDSGKKQGAVPDEGDTCFHGDEMTSDSAKDIDSGHVSTPATPADITTVLTDVCSIEPQVSGDPPMVSVRPATDKHDMKGCAIIVLIGATGTGKSNFIEKIASQTPGGVQIAGIAKGKLDAGTLEVEAYRMDHQHLNLWTRKPIILVDTPGLSDRRKSEMEVLGQIKKWMKSHGVKSVDRLFYMDRISDNRMPRSKSKSLDIFKALCGVDAASRTVVVTTMWDLMFDDRLQDQAANRFRLLSANYWDDFLAKGCKIDKFDNTFEAAVRNLRAFGLPTNETGPGFAFEKDVEMRETEAGRVAFEVLKDRYENLHISLQVVEQDIKHSEGMQNEELDRLLKKQHAEITSDLKVVSDELKDYDPEYQQFRDDVHNQLDQAGSPKSRTTNGSGQKITLKSKLEGWVSNLKNFSTGKSVEQPSNKSTADTAFTNLPDIREVHNSVASTSSNEHHPRILPENEG